MAKIKPVILHEAGCQDSWDDEMHGRIKWRTLISNEYTPTAALTAGVAEILPGDQLKDHRHAPPELYYFLSGEGVASIEGVEYPVKVDTTVFIPGNATHGIRNTGQTTLRLFYVFAVNSFSEVEYAFSEDS